MKELIAVYFRIWGLKLSEARFRRKRSMIWRRKTSKVDFKHAIRQMMYKKIHRHENEYTWAYICTLIREN